MSLRPTAIADLAAPRLFPVSPHDGYQAPGMKRPKMCKEPLIQGYPDEASTSPRWLARWMRRFPGCWGGATLEGLLVLDFDHGRGGSGVSARGCIEAFLKEFGALPQLAHWRRTRSGGLHVTTRAPADLIQWNGRGFRKYGEAGKVDVKLGRGCFVIVEGEGYGFLGGLDTFNPAELPETPANVAEAVRLKLKHRASLSQGVDSEAWRELCRRTRRYWPLPFFWRTVDRDCARLPTVTEGQGAELNRLAFIYGRCVEKRYISAAAAFNLLRQAALQMTPPPGEHWPEPEVWVERQLKRAILAGAKSVKEPRCS